MHQSQLVAQIFAHALARKRGEEALRASEARLAAGTELVGLGYYEVDDGKRTCFLDDRFRATCGVPSDLQQGLDPVQFWLEHIHPEDRQPVQDQHQKLHSGEVDQISVDYRYLHPTKGQRRLHHLARVAWRGTGGAGMRTLGMIRDITAQKPAEEALLKSHAEIERLKDRLQAESDYLQAEVKVTQAQGEVVGKSAPIRKVLSQAEQVAPTDSSMLISGETGTGKELIAQTIHRLGSRGSHMMVKVNVRVIGATNRDLAEEVRKGRFRADLHYRLNVFAIRRPAGASRASRAPPRYWG